MKRLFILLGKSVLALLSVAGVLLLAFEGWLIWHVEYGIGLPTETQLAALPGTGALCSSKPGNLDLPLNQIPPFLQRAVIASEDPGFDHQTWMNPVAQLIVAIFTGRRPQGSVITFRVSRHCLFALAPDCCRGLDWHLGNLVFMGRIERVLSYDRIIEAYLNDSYFGRGAYGLATGATAYFGKPLERLDVDEIAFLVARLRHPIRTRETETCGIL